MAVNRTSVVYVGTKLGEIHSLRVNGAGDLMPFARPMTVFSASGEAGTIPSTFVGMAVHPAKQFLFGANVDDRTSMVFETTIRGFRIGPDGALSPVAGASLQIKDIIGEILMDPKGRYLYVNARDALLTFGIRSTGDLKFVHRAESLNTFSVSDDPEWRTRLREGDHDESCVAFLPSGRTLLVYRLHQWSSGQMAGMTQYKIGSNGTLTRIPSPLDGTSSSGDYFGSFLLSGDGKLLYVNAKRDSDEKIRVDVLRVEQRDRLVRVPQGCVPSDLLEVVALDPLGRFVFGLRARSLDTYQTRRDGTLTRVASLPVTSPVLDGAFVDGTGRFLYVPQGGLQYTCLYNIYTIGTDGKLTLLRQTMLPPYPCSFATVALP